MRKEISAAKHMHSDARQSSVCRNRVNGLQSVLRLRAKEVPVIVHAPEEQL
jgi:hypothetical protein